MNAEVPSSVAVKAEEPEPESEVQQADVNDSPYEFLGFLEEEPADECASSSAAQSTSSTKCPHCGIAFPSSFSLKHHLTVNHAYLICTSCKVLKPGHAFIRNHSVATFSATCVVCLDVAEKQTRYNGEVTRIVAKFTRQGAVEHTKLSLKCPDCDFETSSKSYLFQHLAVAHNRVQLSRVKRFMRCRKCKHAQPGEDYVHFDETSRTFFIADACMRCAVPQGVVLRCWKYSVPSVALGSQGPQSAGIMDLRRGNFKVVGHAETNQSTQVPSGTCMQL